MKIEQSSKPIKQCCDNLLGDFLHPNENIIFQ
jgi:hypothetical protein